MVSKREEQFKKTFLTGIGLPDPDFPEGAPTRAEIEAKEAFDRGDNLAAVDDPREIGTRGIKDPSITGTRFSIQGVDLTRDEFNQAEGLIRNRIPPDSGQFKFVSDAVKDAVGRSEVNFPSPFTSPAERAEGAAVEAEAQRVLSEEAPVRPDLTPEPRAGQGTPFLGGSIAVLQNILINKFKSGKSRLMSVKGFGGKEGLIMAELTKDLDPEELKFVAETEIEAEIFNEGLTVSEETGAIIDSIPFIPREVKPWIGGAELPSDNLNEVLKNINKNRELANRWEGWAATGEKDAGVALRAIEEIEQEVLRHEARAKLLINYSPELRFESDKIDGWETDILRTKEVINVAKARAIRGKIRDPTELELFLLIKRYEEE